MSSLTPGRIRLYAILAAAAPMGALLVVRFLDPFGAPPAAGADVIENPEPDGPSVPRIAQPTAREREAAAGIHSMIGTPEAPTPFYYAPGALHDTTPTPVPVETPNNTMPSFDVSAILAGAGSPIAVINGTALRVGQAIEGGWSLQQVNEAERAVIIAHEDGRDVRISIRR